jgi:hypothetical protein
MRWKRWTPAVAGWQALSVLKRSTTIYPQQIEHLTGRKARHLAELLWENLRHA